MLQHRQGQGPLKGKKSTKSQSDSEAMSLPVWIQLKNLANKNLFETIRDEASKNLSESTDTEGVTEGQGASGVRSTCHKSPFEAKARKHHAETRIKALINLRGASKYWRTQFLLGSADWNRTLPNWPLIMTIISTKAILNKAKGLKSELDYESLPRHATNSPTVTGNDILAKVKKKCVGIDKFCFDQRRWKGKLSKFAESVDKANNGTRSYHRSNKQWLSEACKWAHVQGKGWQKAGGTVASVRRPCTLIAIWTFVSCVRGLLSPASLNMRARATLPRVVLLLRMST